MGFNSAFKGLKH